MSGISPFSVVKTLQRGTKVLAATSDTVTVTAVDTAKSLLLMNFECDNVAVIPGDAFVRGTLTNGTTLTFTKGTATGNSTISWQLVEFN